MKRSVRCYLNLAVVLLFVSLPVCYGAPDYLFVFHRDQPTASVYDAASLRLLGNPSVGIGAHRVLAVTDRSDPKRVEKFYVIARDSIQILGPDFKVKGTLFLSDEVAPGSDSAALSGDRTRLLVAAGEQLYIVNTDNDSIIATVRLDSPPSGVAVLPGSDRAYVISSSSRLVRVVDLKSNQLLDSALELPAIPSSIAVAPDRFGVYVATPGAIYEIDADTDVFFKPVRKVTLARGRGTESAASKDLDVPQIGSLEAAGRLRIDKFLPTIQERFLVRSDGRLLLGRFGVAGASVEVKNPATGEPFPAIIDAEVSPDGRNIFVVSGSSEPRLTKSELSGSGGIEELALASEPSAISLVSPEVDQAGPGSLTKFSGDAQTIQSGATFTLVMQALDSANTPQTGISVSVVATVPSGPVVSCLPSAFPTNSNGLVTINCTAGSVSSAASVLLFVLDSLGRSTAAPFSVAIVPSITAVNGLHKVSGDGQTVLRNSVFPLPLVVSSVRSGTPRSGVTLSVTTAPTGVATCTPVAPTDTLGRASIICSALSVAENRIVQVFVNDSLGRSLPQPFIATVLPTSAVTDGLRRVSGDSQTVRSNSAFPAPLVVRATAGGNPQRGLTLTTNTSPSGVVSCVPSGPTNSAGEGRIFCTSATVAVTTSVQIFVGDNLGRSLLQPFTALVLPDLPTAEGLSKVSGDNQFVLRNSVFPLPLIVSSVLNGVPQANQQLTVTSSLPSLVFCPVAVFTGPNGLGSISCVTGTVTAAFAVRIFVSDSLGRSLSQPFTVTVVPTTAEDVASLNLLTPVALAGEVGETITNAIRVEARDNDGRPVAGVPIVFSSSRDIRFDPPVALTGINGRASTSVTFGCFRGTGSIRVGVQPGVTLVTVSFTTTAGPLADIVKAQGDNQSGSPGMLLNQQALVVRLGDVCGNPIVGQRVTWSVNPPDAGTLVNTISVSDANGRSSTLVRLGNRAGAFTVTAVAGGFSAVFQLRINVVATQLLLVSGNNQTVALGALAPQPLVVRVVSDSGAGVAGVTVNFMVVAGSASLSAGSAVTSGSEGRASVTLTGGNALGRTTVVATAVNRSVTFTIDTIGRVPALSVSGFVNGASFRPGWVPGGLGTIFGTGLMEGVAGVVQANQVPFPTALRGVRVIVNGTAAPIISLANINGQEQINIQVPFGTSTASEATVVIENNGSSTTIAGVPVFALQPGIFEIGLEGVRVAAALHADFRLVTPSDPARPGELILLFLTGLGPTDPAVTTNRVGPVPPARTIAQPRVGVDDAGMEVLGSFYAPGLITVYQINFRLSQNVQSGNRKLSVVADGASGQNVVLPVRR